MSDKNYDLLLNQYNLMVSRYRDVKEQYQSSQRQWENEEAYFKRIEDLARTLCEDVLAKDRSEMVLGTDYSWSNIPTDELINKAISCFKKYNQNRTELMRSIMDIAEERRYQIESLKDQIEQFILNGNVADVKSIDEVMEKSAKESAIEEAKTKVSNQIKSAVAAGKVELIIEDSDEIEVDGESKAIRDLMNKNEQAKITAHTIPINDSKAKKEKFRKEKDNAIMSHIVDLKEFEDRVTEAGWIVLEIMGSQGVSKYPEIEAKTLQVSEVKKTKIRVTIQNLYKAGIVSQECIKLPLSPKCFIYTLSDIGLRLYKEKFGKDAVESEAAKLMKEHDNLAHGYGILDVEKILRDSGRYKSISSFNREKAISLKNGKQYVPDIICITDRYKEYVEYERGTHTQSDFNEKCNKMTQVTRYLNFVTPSKDVITKRLVPQINEWIKTRDVRSLRNIKVRIATALSLRDGDLKDDSCWQVIYDLKQGSSPIKTIE